MRRLWAAATLGTERIIFLPSGYNECVRRGELKIAAARVGILERSRRRRRLSGDPY